jgi:hypothetical protein
LTSQELEKWGEIWMKGGLPAKYDEQAGVTQEILFPIFLGREMFDKEMFLPLSRHKSVQLEIEHAFTAAADGGFATGTLILDVKALITPNEALLNYLGTLSVRRLYTHTTVASGDKNFDMPGNAVIRAIGTYCYEAGVADDTNITKVVLQNRRNGQYLLEQGWDDFIHNTFVMVGGFLERFVVLFCQNNDTYKTRIGEILSVFTHCRLAVDTTNDAAVRSVVDAIAGDQVTIDAGNIDITAGSETITADATDRIVDLLVKGKYPSYFGLVPLFFPDEPSGYWDEGDKGNLRLIATQGNAGATAKVSVQELQRW